MPYHLALLSDTFPPDPGGLAISAARLAHGIAAHGHQVEVFAPTPHLPPGEVRGFRQDAVQVWRFGAQRKPDATLAEWFDLLLTRHAETPFDLFHAYFMARSGFVAVYAGRSVGVPSIVSARGNDLDRAVFDPGKAAHIRYALEYAERVTANTQQLVARARALAPTRSIHLIPNGVENDIFTPGRTDAALAQRFGLKTGQPVLAFVGEARAKKGLALLLLAFRELAHRRPLSLWLLGGVRSGPDHDLVALFQRQNPDLDLVVTPAREHQQMPACYRLIDLLVLPSLHDGLPNALLEGMATARPIVASHAGGIPDALRHEQNGLLVPPGQIEPLIAAIERMLDDSVLRVRLGSAARATVIHEFTPTAEIATNLELYHDLCADRA
ncbi:glycosyltransferase [Candidatus Oscillochloris fontis]|uniref:glycosyltransferase n=1 Tax=Candidatus Oscillochloris fontis TaxID=2496868 RepID=UPI00101B9416|nr:glycosyltransferase [Candidatus Oscillochloris fontis]